ncbi:MAG: cytochrome c biogenesis CcdA family protein [Anaerolineae bacterium]|nr:cytochrome c biogenesis CcdA family protein [Anaerolineae bacterium]
MPDISVPTLGLSFFAGLASFLSPCVFALVPAYVGYLSGRSVAAMSSDEKANSWTTLGHGLAFVLGFSLVFILLGVVVGSIRVVLNSLTWYLVRIGGLVVIVFGLHMMGIINIKFLNYDLRPEYTADRKRGYLSSAMMGVFFSAGWAPCIGPVLGLISTFAINGGSIAVGASLFAAYSAGLAIPFLIAATQIGWVTTILRKHGRVMVIAEKTMGLVMVIIGFLLILGRFETFLAQFSQQAFFDLESGSELIIGQVLLYGALIAGGLGLIPAWIGKQKGKNFIDWWFMGTGASILLLVVVYFFGGFASFIS